MTIVSQEPGDFREGPPDELGQVMRTDASGNVDVSLVEYFVSLTPAQRLEHVERFASTVVDVWKDRGIEWSGSERF
jgi:hypothetical protein